MTVRIHRQLYIHIFSYDRAEVLARLQRKIKQRNCFERVIKLQVKSFGVKIIPLGSALQQMLLLRDAENAVKKKTCQTGYATGSKKI